MFRSAKKFNCNISNWKLPKLRDASYMFYNAENFDSDCSTWTIPTDIVIPHWDVFFNTKIAGDKSKWPERWRSK